MPLSSASGHWLTQHIRTKKIRKKDICSAANIQYKTLRSYCAGVTVPTLTADQWQGFAEGLQIPLMDLMKKFMASPSN
ncbi:hypothetical protein U2F10_03195 [Leptothoe sp. EHU-05/26/07-4]